MRRPLATLVEPHVVSAPAVAVRIADFLVATEMERLRLFRLHLASTVVRVSPLLPDLAAMQGISIVDAAALMHPPRDWPWRPLTDAPSSLPWQLRQSWARSGGKDRSEAARFRRSFANPGVVIREADNPLGRFAIRPVGGVLGFTAGIGPCLLSAFGPTALLKLPHALPETLSIALPGRTLDGIIDHPLFRGGNYIVSRVVPDLSDDLPVLMFRARLVAFESPWCAVR
jgi:hypothetical protein